MIYEYLNHHNLNNDCRNASNFLQIMEMKRKQNQDNLKARLRK